MNANKFIQGIHTKPNNYAVYAITSPSGTVWLLVLAGVLVSDVVVWVLLRVVAWVTGAGDTDVGGSVLYSWAVLMENPPPPPSSSSTIRVCFIFSLALVCFYLIIVPTQVV